MTTKNDYAVLNWLVLATFIVILNETVMINAIPRLMVEFSVSARSAQWLSTAFMLTMAVVIPVTGWFLQRVTTRGAFATAMAVFSAGTLLAALAPTFPVLLAGRVVQASGTAVMMPLLMTTLMTVVPVHDRGRVMGNVTLAISVAPALGPALSGVVLQNASWRWMFGIVLPIAVAISFAGLRRLTNLGEPQRSSVDWFSVVLSAVGFGGFVYGLSQLGASSLLGALQQVAAAVGTAIVVTVLSSRSADLARGGADQLHAMVGGMQWAFGVGAVLAVAMLALAFLLPGRAEPMTPPEPDLVVDGEGVAVPEPV